MSMFGDAAKPLIPKMPREIMEPEQTDELRGTGSLRRLHLHPALRPSPACPGSVWRPERTNTKPAVCEQSSAHGTQRETSTRQHAFTIKARFFLSI